MQQTETSVQFMKKKKYAQKWKETKRQSHDQSTKTKFKTHTSRWVIVTFP